MLGDGEFSNNNDRNKLVARKGGLGGFFLCLQSKSLAIFLTQ